MTDATAPVTDEGRPPATGSLARARRALGLVLGPLWVTAFRDPVREGRLRLDALSRVERQLARAGLVMLGVLLASMLLSRRWREGELLPMVGGPHQLELVPVGAIGLTLLALALGWAMILWGALDASPAIRVVVAALFGLTMVHLGRPTSFPGTDSWWVEHGGTVVHTGYLVLCGAPVLSALVAWVPKVGRSAGRVVDPVLRVVVLAALAAFFLGRLGIYVATSRKGLISTVPFELDSAVNVLNTLTLPLIFVTAIVVVDLALDVATSLEQPARRLSARWALTLLLAVLALKLWVTLVPDRQVWLDLLQNQPWAVARTAGSMALLVVLVAVVTRFKPTSRFVDVKERLIYLGALVLGVPFLVSLVGYGAAVVGFTEFDTSSWMRFNDRIPYDRVTRWYPLVAAVLALAIGVWLLRRRGLRHGDELGSALVVMGGWNIPLSTDPIHPTSAAVSYAAVDLLVPLGALVAVGAVAVRRRGVPAPTSVLLTALVVFSWLVMSRGDYISFAGTLLGLSGVVVLAFGVVYSLVSDAAFASESSRRLPREARPLLFVGFTLVSVVLVHWLEVTHEQQELAPGVAFTRIAIPLAAWLVGRRLLRGQGSSSGEPGSLPEEVGDGVGAAER